MSIPDISYCPGTLKKGHSTYSSTALRRVFDGRKVSHVLPYTSPANSEAMEARFINNRKRISISGVQEKFSVVLEKNKLRLSNDGERSTYILKPIPGSGKRNDQMPANEHLSMQIARQVFNIEIAENALIFFEDGTPAYITKRFDVKEEGSKRAQEDFATVAGRTPQTHGTDYKYNGNYLEIFQLMRKHVPAYAVEAIKLYKLILFNYLISNGDAHFKNFSLIETPLGDFKLSPAYDLLNSRIHMEDSDFALNEGLLPAALSKGKIIAQFFTLGTEVGIDKKMIEKLFDSLREMTVSVEQLVNASFLDEKTKRNYLQSYQGRLKRLMQ